MASENPHGDEHIESAVAAPWGEGGDVTPSLDHSNSSELQDQHQMADQFDESAEIGDVVAGSPQEYDPAGPSAASAVPIPSPTAVRPSPAESKQTIGGFIVGDDSDEEEDDGAHPAPGNTSAASLQVPSASSGNQAAPQDRSPTEHVTNGVAQATSTSFPSVNAQTDAPDLVARLAKRVEEDPRGEMDSWLALMDEYRRQNKLEETRSTHDRFLKFFPHSAATWAKWIEFEIDNYNFAEAEKLFGRCLMAVPNVELWTVYLNYIRRRNDTLNDPAGTARKVITQAYEFVLNNIGVDKDSGKIWQDYVQFIRSGPGTVGGSSWQDQTKMDQMRKAFHRAIGVPTPAVTTLWREYEQFESGLNKTTARKFTAERNPTYMTAKGANIALENMTRRLKRTTYPRLPPVPGFEGDTEFADQLEIWKKWIAYEKDDPLVLKDDDPAGFKQRVLYCFKQALMAMRFVPEIWVDAAEWCFKNQVMNGNEDTGLQFLTQGVAANPESVVLALKHADRIESTFARTDDSDDEKRKHADAVREPYNRLLDTLYDMGNDLKDKEQADIAEVKKLVPQADAPRSPDGDEDENRAAAEMKSRVEAITASYTARSEVLSKTISHVWIALARAMRRIQGKGIPHKNNSFEGGLRQTFLDARKKGRLTSDVYVAVAQMESVVYGDVVGAKIFERGLKLFPNDEYFVLEYLKHLHSKNDTTNAQVIFERFVTSLSKPESIHKTKILFSYFHKYESQFGELDQIMKLEERMAELFPDDPDLVHFTERFQTETFNPIKARIIISPNSQLRPKMLVPSIEHRASVHNSPAPAAMVGASPRTKFIRATASPKRPFLGDDLDERPRKLARGESPLKGAAGRRLDQQRRHQAAALHREITFFMSILPRADSYNGPRVNHRKLASTLASIQVPDFAAWKATQDQSLGRSGSARPAAVSRHPPPPVEFPAYGQYPDPRASAQPLSPYGVPGRLGGPPPSMYQQPRPDSRGFDPPHQTYPPRPDGPPQYGHVPPPGTYPPVQPQPQYGRYPPY